ncbi:MFS transporter [Nonomuraea sp. NPDC050556]|uniref:MFS transporter n=1 Tax=Nonomuraea sp. NPDC050556 TaxID=3364369 RepID=UPI0037ACDB44
MSSRWLLLAALSLCALLVSVYATMVITIMPMVGADLAVSRSALQVGVYVPLLAFAGAFVPAPRRQRVLLVVSVALGLAAFGLATALCGLAPMPGLLVGGRALQGLAGAVVLWAGTGLIRASFPGPELWRAISVPVVAILVGLVAGPLVGGIAAEYLSWRWGFLAGLPLVAVALVVVVVIAAVQGREEMTTGAGKAPR